MPKRVSSNIIALTFGVLLLCFLTAFYISAAWQGPTALPPSGNVDMPLNVGSVYQEKIGPLIINRGGAATGFIVEYGNVGIGTATPNNLIQVANLVNFPNSITGTFLGYQAGNVTTGGSNTFIGYQSGLSNIGGSNNTAVGKYALYSNTAAVNNTASGMYSLYSNTLGSDNTANGISALYANISGNQNTAIGVGALQTNTTGAYNTASGKGAGYFSQTGDFNVFIGLDAAFGVAPYVSASRNTVIGYEAGYNLTNNQSDNIFLGYHAGYNETGSNKLYIANSSIAPPLIYGDFASQYINIGAAAAPTNANAKLKISGTAGVNGIEFPDGTLQTTAAVGGTSTANVGVTTGTVLDYVNPSATVINHNLGIIPKIIRVTTMRVGVSNNNAASMSIGVALIDTSNGNIISQNVSSLGASEWSSSGDFQGAGIAGLSAATNATLTGTLSGVTSTQMTITFPGTGYGTLIPSTGAITFQWEVVR